MHETVLMTDLVSRVLAVAAAERAPRVASVSVRLGALSHVSPATFVEQFREAARDSLAADAELDVTLSEDTSDPRASDVVLMAIEVETAEDRAGCP